jgi:hypothetical protein
MIPLPQQFAFPEKCTSPSTRTARNESGSTYFVPVLPPTTVSIGYGETGQSISSARYAQVATVIGQPLLAHRDYGQVNCFPYSHPTDKFSTNQVYGLSEAYLKVINFRAGNWRIYFPLSISDCGQTFSPDSSYQSINPLRRNESACASSSTPYQRTVTVDLEQPAVSHWQKAKDVLVSMIRDCDDPAYESEPDQTHPANATIINEALATLETLEEGLPLPKVKLFDDGSIMLAWDGPRMEAGVRFTGGGWAGLYFLNRFGKETLEDLDLNNQEIVRDFLRRIAIDCRSDQKQ